MGNDGGSIPTRRELVKSAPRQPTHSQLRDTSQQASAYHWSTCPLSKSPLSSPTVSDSLGRLYNKDAVLEWLLRGTEAFGDGDEVLGGRVKSLKDIVEVKFTVEDKTSGGNGNAGNGNGNGVEDGRTRPAWVCPVSRKELGPGVRAVYIVPCGHAFTESAVKEVGASESGCLTCGAPYEPSNVIPINATEPADLDKLRTRAKELAEKGLSHALKKIASDGKSKKRKKGQDTTAAVGADASGKEEKKRKEKKAQEGGIKNAATASLTNKVLQDEKAREKRRKVEMSDNVKSLFATKKDEVGKNTDFMSRGYSFQAGVQR